MTVLYFAIIAVVSYLVGTINFARIISWIAKKKDITEIGSKNPGTMNIIRNFGVGLGMLTLVAEVVKTGLCCVIAKACMNGLGLGEVAFYFSGFFVVIGNDYPVFFKFKGGKGVACTGGMFLFSNLWWLGLIMFLVGVVMIMISDYGFLSSLTFIVAMATAVTIWAFCKGVNYAWAICIIVWALTALSFFKHRGNINRLIHGCENKSNFKKSVLKLFKKHKEEAVPVTEETTPAVEGDQSLQASDQTMSTSDQVPTDQGLPTSDQSSQNPGQEEKTKEERK